MDTIELLEHLSIEAISDAMDCLNIKGLIDGMTPISKTRKVVGIAYTVQFCEAYPKGECMAADYIDNVPKESVICIDNNDSPFCSVWGRILTQTAQLKHIKGTIIYGACRDIDYNSSCSYPIFAKHITCKTGKGVVKLKDIQCPLEIQGVIVSPGDYVVADNYSVIIIPKRICKKVIQKALEIEKVEGDIISAVKHGSTLMEARKKYNYNKYM